MENSLVGLACLSTGLVNVMIPANAVADQLAFIMNQTEAQVLLIS